METLSEDVLYSIIDKSGIGIVILDNDKKICFVNLWFLKYSTYTRDSIIAKDFLSIFPELKETRILKSIDLCLDHSQYSILTHTLNPFPFPLFESEKNKIKNIRIHQYIHIIPIVRENEKSNICMIQISDVSQQVLRENLLREQMNLATIAKNDALGASEAKSVFLASMSHEIRTPLNSILGMTDTLDETELSSEQREYVTVLKNSGKALFNIISDILDLSRIEAGKFNIDSHNFSVSNLVHDTISIFLNRAKTKEIDLSYHIESDVPNVFYGDSTRIQQVLINLIGNAMKFTEHGSIRVEVRLSDSKKYIEYSIKDTGIGIPVDKLHSIFESFTQVDNSTTRKFGGTGLGLTITQKLIHLLGGDISVMSQLNVGSKFTFHLPIHDQKENQTLEIGKWLDTNLPTPEKFPKIKVLLAEDSDENIFLIKTFFKKYPIHVEVAYNGEEAVRLFSLNQFHLVLMDMQMPILDGYAATKKIRELEQLKGTSIVNSTPIIAISANVQKEDIEKSFLSGVTSYLSKPVRKIDLLKIVFYYSAL